jgi:hypothetical protein
VLETADRTGPTISVEHALSKRDLMEAALRLYRDVPSAGIALVEGELRRRNADTGGSVNFDLERERSWVVADDEDGPRGQIGSLRDTKEIDEGCA